MFCFFLLSSIGEGQKGTPKGGWPKFCRILSALRFASSPSKRSSRQTSQAGRSFTGSPGGVWQVPEIRRADFGGCCLEQCARDVKEEGRGTRNGYEASKGSKGISGL